MKLKVAICLLFVVFTLDVLFAQSPQYRQYTASDGLPSATVYGMIQDKKGYIWFGTENGAAIFDGKTFQTFTKEDGLTDNIILDLYQDKQDRIWFFTLNGILCYYKNGRIYNPQNDTLLAKLPPWFAVYSGKSFLDDEEGNVYFAAFHSTIKIGRHGFNIFKDPPNVNYNDVVKLNASVSLIVSNRILFKPGTAVCYYNENGIVRYHHSMEKLIGADKFPFILRPGFQNQLSEDFWISTFDHGIIKVKQFAGKNPVFQKYLPEIQVSRIFEDNEENLWFSTSGEGVFLIPRMLKNVVHYRKTDGLPQEDIKVVYKDKQQAIWAGSVKNNLYCLKNNHLYKYTMPSSERGFVSPVYDICQDALGHIYVANIPDLIKYNSNEINPTGVILKTALIENPLFIQAGNYKSLTAGKNGVIIAASKSWLSVYDPQSALGKHSLMKYVCPKGNDRIFTATVSSKGIIWVANNNGLNKLVGDSLYAIHQLNPILKEPISRIVETPDGNLLLATRSKGVVVFDGTKIVQVFNKDNGLASDICNRIYIDGTKVWMATSKGLSQLFYLKGKLVAGRNYSIDDGLLSNEINDVTTKGDTIYVATAQGLSVLLEKKAVMSVPPALYLTSAQYGEDDILQTNNSNLSYNNKYLKFGFIAITFQQPKNVQYMYRLTGADDTWKLNTSGTVDYPALLPGKYIFEIKAKKFNSNWSDTKQFHFVVLAPFWMQTWFYALLYFLLLCFLGMVIYYFIKQKKNAQLKKAEIKNRMVQLEQQALSALMNPHFIFNALNSIQEYLHQNDKLSANKYLSLFARLTRKNMEAVMKNTVSLEDEFERLELYLNFEKLRFGDKLKYKIVIPEDMPVDELHIPPMVLQPFVENAIWHGLMPLEDGGQIIISARMLDEMHYEVVIRDTGIGFKTSMGIKKNQELTHQSKGMILTNERLDLWTKNRGVTFSLLIEEVESGGDVKGGTVVRLKLPTLR